MANCSESYGTITFKSNKEVNKALAEVIYATNHSASYYTDFDLKSALKDIATENEPTIAFWGCGRWTYSLNVEMLYEWMKHDMENDYIDAEDKEKIKAYWKLIQDSDWELVFKYKDQENGLEVLYEATEIMSHRAGADETTVKELESTTYDYTVENLRKLGYDDEANWQEENNEEYK